MRIPYIVTVAALFCLAPSLSPAPPLQFERLDSDGTSNRIRIRYNIPFLPSGEGIYSLRDGVDEVFISPGDVVPDTDSLGVTIIAIPSPIGPDVTGLPQKYTMVVTDVVTDNGTESLSQDVAFLASTPDAIRAEVSPVTGLLETEGLWIKTSELVVSSTTFDNHRIFLEPQTGNPKFGLMMELDDIAFLVQPEELVFASGRLETDSTGNLRLLVSEPTLLVMPPIRRGPRAPIIPTVKNTGEIEEDSEATLVGIEGRFAGIRRGGSFFDGGNFYTFEDAFGTIEVLITLDSNLDGVQIPEDDFTLVGTVFQNATEMPFLDGYSLAPRAPDDLVQPSSANQWNMYE